MPSKVFERALVCPVVCFKFSKMLVRPATEADLLDAFHLINEAYEVETGNSGVAFKHTKRFLAHDELKPHLNRALVAEDEGKLAGIVVYDINGTACHFGPFAVRGQGKGVGKLLLQHIEQLALKNGCNTLDIEVVHWRTDIIPMYEKWGYVRRGEAPFPAPERTTRPCHFIVMSKAIGTGSGS